MSDKVILLNPGPTNVSQAVIDAASGPLFCHREPEYFTLQDEVRERLVRVMGLDPDVWTAVLIAGSGTSAMESMILAGVPEGKTLVVSDNGVYGDRIVKMAKAHGIPVTAVTQPWTEATDPALLAERCEQTDNLGAVCVIHHETTTGLLNPVEECGAVAKKYGVNFLVDSVSGLAGDPLDLEAANVDIVASTGGKNFQGMPALSFGFARREKLEEARAWSPRSVYLDFVNLYDKQEQRGTPFTPAVPFVVSLRQALIELEEETVAGRIARYGAAARFLREGYQAMGLPLWLPEGTPLSNCLTTICLPEGKTYTELHDYLKERGFVIYAGQGKIEAEAFRIANMGNVEQADYQRLLDTLSQWVNS
jgi:2-aminoethylphosphonate-pyruvate transaminase